MSFHILEKLALGDVFDQARGLSTQYLNPSYQDLADWVRLNKIETPKKYLKKTAAYFPKLSKYDLKRHIRLAAQGSPESKRILSRSGKSGTSKVSAYKFLEQEKNNRHFKTKDYEHMMFGDDVEKDSV